MKKIDDDDKLVKKETIKKHIQKPRKLESKKKKKGFTLIEVLVVVIIIGIIALIAVPTVSNYIGQAKDTAYTSFEESMKNAAKNRV